MFDELDFDYNKSLKDALAAAAEDYSEENWAEVICHLTVGIICNEEILIPVPKLAFMKVEFDPDAEFEDIFPEDLPEDDYSIVEMPDGRLWLPLFTDEDEVNEMTSTHDTKSIPLREAFEMALANGELTGVLINIFSDIFIIPREFLERILEEADKNADGFDDFEDAG